MRGRFRANARATLLALLFLGCAPALPKQQLAGSRSDAVPASSSVSPIASSPLEGELEDEPTASPVAALTPPPADAPPASYPFQSPLAGLDATAFAVRYGNLSAEACKKEVTARELPVARHKKPTKGVATP